MKTLVKKPEITNGCGGKKGTKCGVEVYIMPYMLVSENPYIKNKN